jgi:hypothetical protein
MWLGREQHSGLPLLNPLRLIREVVVNPNVNFLHKIIDASLTGWGPLRIVLPHDLWRVPKNVCDIFECRPVSE